MQDLRENIFTDKAKLELTLAKEISQKLEQEIKKKGEATLLVSGGSTPKKLYEILSDTEIDWNNVSIGLIDERFVATDTDESNELLIKNTLLKNKAADATSSGNPYLFWGICCRKTLLVSLSCIFLTSSVSIAPGHSVFTVMLNGANSMERTLLKAITPPFEAP